MSWWGGETVSLGGIVLVNGIKHSPRMHCFSDNTTITGFPLTASRENCALTGNAIIPRHAR